MLFALTDAESSGVPAEGSENGEQENDSAMTGRASEFRDVPENAWYYEAVTSLTDRGILNGYEDGTFAPNAPIKRCEVVKILNGVIDRTPDASTVNEHIADYTVRIPDITSAHWAYYEILEAAIEHDHADFHKAN